MPGRVEPEAAPPPAPTLSLKNFAPPVELEFHGIQVGQCCGLRELSSGIDGLSEFRLVHRSHELSPSRTSRSTTSILRCSRIYLFLTDSLRNASSPPICLQVEKLPSAKGFRLTHEVIRDSHQAALCILGLLISAFNLQRSLGPLDCSAGYRLTVPAGTLGNFLVRLSTWVPCD